MVTPGPKEMLNLQPDNLKKVLAMKLTKGPILKQEGNTFQGFTLQTQNVQEIRMAYINQVFLPRSATYSVCICHPRDGTTLCTGLL